MEALGSDVDPEEEAEAFVDNDGNPLRVRRKKKKYAIKYSKRKYTRKKELK